MSEEKIDPSLRRRINNHTLCKRCKHLGLIHVETQFKLATQGASMGEIEALPFETSLETAKERIKNEDVYPVIYHPPGGCKSLWKSYSAPDIPCDCPEFVEWSLEEIMESI